jgi:hypothetical protein
MTEKTSSARLLGPASVGARRAAAVAHPSDKRSAATNADYLRTPKSSSPILKRSRSYNALVIQLSIDPAIRSIRYVDSLPAMGRRVKVETRLRFLQLKQPMPSCGKSARNSPTLFSSRHLGLMAHDMFTCTGSGFGADHIGFVQLGVGARDALSTLLITEFGGIRQPLPAALFTLLSWKISVQWPAVNARSDGPPDA